VTAELEANQFSTTTKLVGEVIAAVTDTFEGDTDNNTVFQDRVRLDLQTSFGVDILHTRLATGNAQPFEIAGSDVNGDGVADTGTRGTQTLTYHQTSTTTFLTGSAAYDFPLGNARGYLAAAGEFIAIMLLPSTLTLDFDGGNGALSTFAQESPIFALAVVRVQQ